MFPISEWDFKKETEQPGQPRQLACKPTPFVEPSRIVNARRSHRTEKIELATSMPTSIIEVGHELRLSKLANFDAEKVWVHEIGSGQISGF